MTKQTLPRVLVVDDHKIIRDSIEMLANAQNSFQVVGQAANGKEAIEKVAELQPDVVLMDIQMADMNGLEATRTIMAAHPAVRIIALTMINEGDKYMAEMFRAGAMGYIVKSAGMADILIAIDMVMAGQQYIAKELSPALLEQTLKKGLGNGKDTDKNVSISKRELEVLKLIGNGLTNHQIAEQLSISARTVENHRHNILSKTGAKNTAALVAIAKEKMWI